MAATTGDATLRDLSNLTVTYTIQVRLGWRVRFGTWCLLAAARLGSWVSGYAVEVKSNDG